MGSSLTGMAGCPGEPPGGPPPLCPPGPRSAGHGGPGEGYPKRHWGDGDGGRKPDRRPERSNLSSFSSLVTGRAHVGKVSGRVVAGVATTGLRVLRGPGPALRSQAGQPQQGRVPVGHRPHERHRELLEPAQAVDQGEPDPRRSISSEPLRHRADLRLQPPRGGRPEPDAVGARQRQRSTPHLGAVDRSLGSLSHAEEALLTLRILESARWRPVKT